MQLSTINIFQATRIEGRTVNSVQLSKKEWSETKLELDRGLMAVIVTQKNGEKIGIPLGNISSFTYTPTPEVENGSENKVPVTGASSTGKQKARTA